MKKTTYLFLTLFFVFTSFMCYSQTFTLNEFIHLATLNQDDIKSALIEKGYAYTKTESSDLSTNEVYTGSDNMTVFVIIPNFKSGKNLISWEFTGLNNVYNSLKQELVSSGYSSFDREVRSGAKYISNSYNLPGSMVTLSSDKVSNPKGTYILSARYNKPNYYQSTKK